MVYPYCLAVEKLMGVEVPERAKYIRPLVAELNRIGSHFYYFALYGVFLGLATRPRRPRSRRYRSGKPVRGSPSPTALSIRAQGTSG
jgi:NADH:ubiquinone oxidoreductase subunit D